MNRGETRRPLFEDIVEMRFFLSCVARAVHRGEIEVHVFSLIINHFHFLIRSPCGLLSKALQRIQSRYVQWYNRRKHRDGSRLRGRFKSIPVESLVYRRYLVRYIDDNPVEAGITAKGEDYPFGSAYWYSRQKVPKWLSRDWVESEIGDAFGEPLSYARYQELFPTRLSGDEREWVETRLARGGCSPDPLDMLTSASCDEIEGWLLEDEDSLRPPLVPPSLVTSGAERCRGVVRLGSIPFSSTRFSVWDVLGAGLLRQVSALSLAEISQRFGCSVTTARELVVHHRRLLRDESCYSAMAAEIVQEAMRTLFT